MGPAVMETNSSAGPAANRSPSPPLRACTPAIGAPARPPAAQHPAAGAPPRLLEAPSMGPPIYSSFIGTFIDCPCVQAPSAHPLYPATYRGRLGRSSGCQWKALSVHLLPVFSLVSVQKAPLFTYPSALSPRYLSCLLYPCLSSINASITDSGSVFLAAPVVSEILPPSIYMYLHIYYSVSTYTSCRPHYSSFICICIIHASSHLLSITFLAAPLMSCTLPWGVNAVRPAFPSSREQRHQREWREQRSHWGWLREQGLRV